MTANLKITKTILTGLIALAYAGMFLPIQFSNITLVLLLAYSLYRLRLTDLVHLIRSSWFVKIVLVIFLLLILGLLYTENFQNGLFVLEKKASLLLIPLFLLPALLKESLDLKSIFKWIGLITIGSSVILILLAIIKKVAFQEADAFYFEKFTSIHYVYYSIYFATGSLLLIDSVFEGSHRYKPWLIISLFIYSLIILILVASKTGIMAFGVASVVLLYKRLSNKKIFALALLLLVISASVLLYFNETTRSRFEGLAEHLSVLKLDDFRGQEVYITDLNMRLLFWKISLVNIWRDHAIFFGVGTGDVQDYINMLYALPQYNFMGYIDWDSHNQWVFSLIQLGIPGALALAILFIRSFIVGWKAIDVKFIVFLIVILSFSMSESVLESNKGIVFFALLITLFSASYEKLQEKSI